MSKDLPTLQISADLCCEIDSRPLTIRSMGRTIVVEVPNVATGLKLLSLGLPRGSRRKRLHQIKQTLDKLRTSLEIQIARKKILSLGHEQGSRLWQLFGLPALSFRADNVIATLAAKN